MASTFHAQIQCASSIAQRLHHNTAAAWQLTHCCHLHKVQHSLYREAEEAQRKHEL